MWFNKQFFNFDFSWCVVQRDENFWEWIDQKKIDFYLQYYQ